MNHPGNACVPLFPYCPSLAGWNPSPHHQFFYIFINHLAFVHLLTAQSLAHNVILFLLTQIKFPIFMYTLCTFQLALANVSHLNTNMNMTLYAFTLMLAMYFTTPDTGNKNRSGVRAVLEWIRHMVDSPKVGQLLTLHFCWV